MAFIMEVFADVNLTRNVLALLEFPQCAQICSTSKWLYRTVAECVSHQELIQWLPDSSTAASKQEHANAAEVWLQSHPILTLRARTAGKPVSHPCAEIGDATFLATIHNLGAYQDISWTMQDEWGRPGDNVAHIAAKKGHAHFLRMLDSLGYRAVLQARNSCGWTIANFAVDGLHPKVIGVIYALGYGYLFSACIREVADLKQRLKSLDNRYKNGRLSGASSEVQDQRRRTKLRIKDTLRAVKSAHGGG